MTRVRHNWDLIKGARYRVIPRGPAPTETRDRVGVAVRSAVPLGEDGIAFTCRIKFVGDDLHYDVEDFAAVFKVEN